MKGLFDEGEAVLTGFSSWENKGRGGLGESGPGGFGQEGVEDVWMVVEDRGFNREEDLF
ncbi:MAG: hypothetical protein OHK005_15280 [Candidatus Methylacidiphilales bacterium]